MSPHNPLNQLRCLDSSSPEFHDQISDILSGEEYKQWVPNIQGGDLVGLIDYLDKVLDVLDSALPAFRKCLRELRKICGSRTILPASYTLSPSLLRIGRQPVASGGPGDIYRGTLNGSGVCVKRVRVYSNDSPTPVKATKTLFQQAVLWKHLEHPNIVPLLGITSTPLQLVSEWMSGGDLTQYIRTHPDTDRLGLLRDITDGLHYLHSHRVVHGDLKGPNILVDATGRARITDFGFAKVTSEQDVSEDQGHPTRWTAPEILSKQGTYSKQADVFSFALVMVEVFTGAVPFNDSLPVTAMLAIIAGKRPPRPTHPSFTDKLWALMQRCWDQNPDLRPGVSKVSKALHGRDHPPVEPLPTPILAPDSMTGFSHAGYDPQISHFPSPHDMVVSSPIPIPQITPQDSNRRFAPMRFSELSVSERSRLFSMRDLSRDGGNYHYVGEQQSGNAGGSEPPSQIPIDPQLFGPDELQRRQVRDQVFDWYTGGVGGSRTDLQNTHGGRNALRRGVGSRMSSHVNLNHDSGDNEGEYWVGGWGEGAYRNVQSDAGGGPVFGENNDMDLLECHEGGQSCDHSIGICSFGGGTPYLSSDLPLDEVVEQSGYVTDLEDADESSFRLYERNANDLARSRRRSSRYTLEMSYGTGDIFHDKMRTVTIPRHRRRSQKRLIIDGYHENMQGSVADKPQKKRGLWDRIKQKLGLGESRKGRKPWWRFKRVCLVPRPDYSPPTRSPSIETVYLGGPPCETFPQIHEDQQNVEREDVWGIGVQNVLENTPDHLNLPIWKRLINDPLHIHERIALITSIFLDHAQVEMVRTLSGDYARTFIDIVDEVLDSLVPEIHRRCLHYLCWICGHHGLLPRSLAIPLHYDRTKNPLYNGGFADVWKGQSDGREVAAKVLRVYLRDDPGRIKRRFCREVVIWRALRHPNVVPLLGAMMTENRFVMISEWMARGDINEFVKTDISVNRLKLLGDVARGLIYMHGQGVVHGDLKGANILINRNCQACIADFSLFTIIPDQQSFLFSCAMGGTIPWMSPELLDPEGFGLKDSRPTKESDCYALGMVVYEVLSGQTPFAPSRGFIIIPKVLGGERPGRPQGEPGKLFTDALWRVLERCWRPQPSDRTGAKDVLLCLEGPPSPLWSPSLGVGGDGGGYSGAASCDSNGDEILIIPPRPPLWR